ncbi:restriction endonuclease [Acidithiobacillus thiooxidans]|uniref:restriction endonuclease subunit S n=1 Tax=Acidithiobacillus thiooxidans TaxID=930 RepID=UPI001C07B270|nr:restriction endonuclease [Acidithiobacillus thiooxidans]
MSELPVGWVTAALEDVAKWSSGGTPSRSNPSYYAGTIPWLKTGELGPPIVVQTEESISEEAVANSSAKVFPKGSVAVAMYGATIGKASMLGIDAATNQACAVGIPDAVKTKFLYYFLVSQSKAFVDAGKGGAQPNISQGIVKSWEISLPPFQEQTRIVEKLEELLSELDAGMAELKAAQKKLAQYRQSLLKAAEGGALTAEWRQQHLPTETGAQLLQRILTERCARWEAKQLAKFKEQDKTPPKDWQKKYPEPVQPDTSGLPELPQGWVWASVDQLSPDDLANGRSVPTAENGAKVLRLTAIKAGAVDLHEHKLGAWSSEEAAPFAVSEGDLLIVRGNGSLTLVGRAGLVGSVDEQVAYPDTMIRLRVVEAVVSPAWIGLVWDSHVVRSHLERRARTSAGIYKIAQPDIVSATVPVPGLAEQVLIRQALAQQFEQLAAMESAMETGLKQSAAQRQNILRAAFAGQLVPQDPADEPASVLLARIRAERAERDTLKTPRRSKAKEPA